MNTTHTSSFLKAVKVLDKNGYPHVASSCMSYYDKETRGMSIADRARILDLYDEVLLKGLETNDTINPVEIILSRDFVFMKAIARTLQQLELDSLVMPGPIQLTEADIEPT